MTAYAFDNAWQRARQRLTALEAWLDPDTIRHLSERGVDPGWHCLEVGAGGGSIAAWLGNRVGPAGCVVATDLDPRHVAALAHPHVRAMHHDISRDPLPDGAFDLAHTRLVLAHLSDPEAALERLVTSLKPGGWLLVEELDFRSAALDSRAGAEAVAFFDAATAALNRVMGSHGFDPFYGRGLLGDLREHGLTAIGTEGWSSCAVGGSPAAVAWWMAFEQLQEELVATRELSDDEVAAVIALLDNPATTYLTQTMVAAWGQRPAA